MRRINPLRPAEVYRDADMPCSYLALCADGAYRVAASRSMRYVCRVGGGVAADRVARGIATPLREPMRRAAIRRMIAANPNTRLTPKTNPKKGE